MPRRYFRGTLEERFYHYIDRDEFGCWLWTGPITNSGKTEHEYGILVLPTGKKVRAHRFGYELLVGPIPEDRPQLDHLCRQTLCVNPGHLEPVVNKVNTDRGRAAEVNRARHAAKTHCKWGHPLSGSNLGASNLQRVCKACKARRAREARLKAIRPLPHPRPRPPVPPGT